MNSLMAYYGMLDAISLAQGLGTLILGSLVLGAFRAPFILWALAGLSLAWTVGLSMPLIYVIAAVTVIGSLPFIRRQLLSRVIMGILKKVFPVMSDTERIALNAGTVWVDGDLFAGKLPSKRLENFKYPKLNAEEQAYVDGPIENICNLVSDWDAYQAGDFPKKVWDALKKEKVFGMIVPKAYGGLELSALGHSEVVSKLSSRSSALAITAMVPNSLGPAELLIHYGTEDQKNHYLPKLATGEEIPCFALTEPTAGSDAGALQASGIIFKKKDGNLGIRLEWNKRWITLSGIATVIGMAFRCKDPDKLLSDTEDLGITCALIPADTKGVIRTHRHNPMSVPFINCPIQGKDVEIDINQVIGGESGIGKGWQMLMECLSAGRGISLPALCTGGSKLALAAASSFAATREQFGLPIGKFEGIEPPMAEIAASTYMMDAARLMTCYSLDNGEKPSVVSAIMKYHFTEQFRVNINHAIDIQGGTGISMGPKNTLALPYMAAPIGITVEGANILTRTMIIFGQGALRCHPFALKEMEAVAANNLAAFDKAFFGHILHIATTKCRGIIYNLSRGLLTFASFGKPTSKYRRKLAWVANSYAFIADIHMGIYGGGLKRKEKVTGRLADVLSYMFLALATIQRAEAESPKTLPKAAEWALEDLFAKIQSTYETMLDELGGPFKWIISPWIRLNRIGRVPSDKLSHDVASKMIEHSPERQELIDGLFISAKDDDALNQWESAMRQMNAVQGAKHKIKAAIRAKALPKQPLASLIDPARSAGIISTDDANALKAALEAQWDVIQVDAPIAL